MNHMQMNWMEDIVACILGKSLWTPWTCTWTWMETTPWIHTAMVCEHLTQTTCWPNMSLGHVGQDSSRCFLNTEEGSPSAQVLGVQETEVPEKDDDKFLPFPLRRFYFHVSLLWSYGNDSQSIICAANNIIILAVSYSFCSFPQYYFLTFTIFFFLQIGALSLNCHGILISTFKPIH
uniref:Uncharacterized protein n=1 Tax=Micrurus paraensis TaxID=1970185 RepID=A0A2D4KJD6_9SAUR